MKTQLTVGGVARRFGVEPWQVARLYERGVLPEPSRVGHVRVIAEDDIPAIEAALKARGLPRASTPAMAS